MRLLCVYECKFADNKDGLALKGSEDNDIFIDSSLVLQCCFNYCRGYTVNNKHLPTKLISQTCLER